MKYREYESAFIKCPECGGWIDEDSMLCKKCGHDCEREIRNGKSQRTSNSKQPKKYS